MKGQHGAPKSWVSSPISNISGSLLGRKSTPHVLKFGSSWTRLRLWSGIRSARWSNSAASQRIMTFVLFGTHPFPDHQSDEASGDAAPDDDCSEAVSPRWCGARRGGLLDRDHWFTRLNWCRGLRWCDERLRAGTGDFDAEPRGTSKGDFPFLAVPARGA